MRRCLLLACLVLFAGLVASEHPDVPLKSEFVVHFIHAGNQQARQAAILGWQQRRLMRASPPPSLPPGRKLLATAVANAKASSVGGGTAHANSNAAATGHGTAIANSDATAVRREGGHEEAWRQGYLATQAG